MSIDRVPGWLKALAASLREAFACGAGSLALPPFRRRRALWAALPPLAAAFTIFHSRLSDEDMSDAGYYRRHVSWRPQEQGTANVLMNASSSTALRHNVLEPAACVTSRL